MALLAPARNPRTRRDKYGPPGITPYNYDTPTVPNLRDNPLYDILENYIPRPNPTPDLSPDSPASGLPLDRDTALVTDRIIDTINQGVKANTARRESAIDILLGPGGTKEQVGNYYGSAIGQVKRALPLNPFSDALKGALLSAANDDITTQTQGYLRQASEQLAARGLSSGGSTGQQQAGGVFSESLRTRVGAETGLNQAQLGFNTQANAQRQDMINQLMDARARLETGIGTTAAAIRAGDVNDPQMIANELAAAYGIQLSEENREEMMQFIKDLEPTVLEKLVQGIPALVTGWAPSAQFAQAASTVLSGIYG